MTAQRDPDAILASWLEDGPTRLPESTKRAIAVTTRTTHQTRRPMWVPWRFPTMNGTTRFAIGAVAMVAVALGALYLSIGPPSGGVGGPAGSPTPLLSPSATADRPPQGGIITLTDSGCNWEGNAATMTMPEILRIRFRNETAAHGTFILHWIRPGHTYDEGVDYIAVIQQRLTTGEEWPPNEVALPVDNADVPAGTDSDLGWTTAGIGEGPLEEFRNGGNWRWQPGTYGVVCSANASPTGDILTTFLVGPLELTDVTSSPGSTTSP